MMMTNKRLLIVSFFLLIGNQVFAQRFGFVDTDYILGRVPEYRLALEEIDRLSAKWDSDVKGLQEQLDSMQEAFAQEELLLTKEMKEKRENEMLDKEKELRDYQNRVFGAEGLLFVKRQELLKPIQESVYEAIEKVAKQKRLNFIYDKAADYVIVYADERYNYSDYVLEELELGDIEDQLR